MTGTGDEPVSNIEEVRMLAEGKATKVTLYLSEGEIQNNTPAASNIIDFLYFRGVAGATVTKGVAGFGASHRLHSSSLVAISDHLPVKIEFIETPEKANELLPRLRQMVGSGMIEIQETTIIKPAQVSTQEAPDPAPQFRLEGKARLMQIFIGESDRWRDEPLHEALVRAMRANDLAGATVIRATLGYGAHRRIHREKPFHLSRDLSLVITVVDKEEKLKAFLPIVEQMVGEGLIVISDAEVIKYSSRRESGGVIDRKADSLRE